MLVVFLLLIPSMLNAACTGTSPIWTTTPDYASISTCVSQAIAGDTINVLSGTATWTSKLVITKGVTLHGAGIDNTIIVGGIADNGNGAITFVPDLQTRSSDIPFRVTGFTIDLNNKDNGSHGILLYNNTATPVTKVRIDHNRIINTDGGSGTKRGIYVMGTIFGVADNNTFEQCNHCIDGEGASGGYTEWSNLTRDFGDAKNFYIEDNTFTNNNTTYSHVYHAGGHGGRYVTRYNTYNQTGTPYNTMLFDVHGNQTAGYGMMVNELYGNKLNMKPVNNSNYIIDQRGSKVLMFYNQYNTHTSTTGHYNRIREEVADSNANAPSGNPGTFIMHVDESYYWNNRHSNNGDYLIKAILDADSCNINAGYGLDPAACYNTGGIEGIKENINFFNHNETYNGTTERGIYCGSSLPANCTAGDGAWITNQSCSDLTGMVGANPSTPISGTLYKCTAKNKWEPYYTPYTYPHPLRNDTTSYTENPQSPTPAVPESPTTTVPPTIAVSPTTKDFGSLNINTSSTVQKFTVTTTGGNLKVDGISMKGTDTTQFTIQNDSCTGKIIDPETGSCTFEAKFSPSSVGAKTANVSIVNNDSNTTEMIALNGTGIANQVPTLSFSPTSFLYGVLSDAWSSPQTITLSNNGAAPVTISSLTLSGTNANQFSIPIATDYCTGETVAAYGNCSFQVIFYLASTGKKTADVNVTALYYDSPASLALFGYTVIDRNKPITISKKK